MNKENGAAIISATRGPKMRDVSDWIVSQDVRIAKIEDRANLDTQIGAVDGEQDGGLAHFYESGEQVEKEGINDDGSDTSVREREDVK